MKTQTQECTECGGISVAAPGDTVWHWETCSQLATTEEAA